MNFLLRHADFCILYGTAFFFLSDHHIYCDVTVDTKVASFTVREFEGEKSLVKDSRLQTVSDLDTCALLVIHGEANPIILFTNQLACDGC